MIRNHGLDHLLVLLRLQLACRIEYKATRTHGMQGRIENRPQTFGLAGQVLRLEAMTDLGITPQRPCSAARNVGKGNIESAFRIKVSRVREETSHTLAQHPQPLLQLSKPQMAVIARDDIAFD